MTVPLKVISGGRDEPADSGRNLPHSVEAEEYLLSCCLLDGSDTVAKCLDRKLPAKAFFNSANADIYAKIVEIYRKAPPVTVEVLAEELSVAGQLGEVGGFPHLLQVSGRIPTSAQAEYFLERVRELWILRELIREGTELVEGCYGFQSNLAEFVETLAGKFNQVLDFVRAGEESMQERSRRALERTISKLEGRLDTSRQVATGLGEFDRRFGVFDVMEEDWLIGVGAVTSGGKSALTRQWVDSFVRQGKVGLVFLLETSIGKWLDAAAAMAARVNARKIDQLPPDLAERFRQERLAREAWLGERVWIYDDPLKAEVICARVAEHVRRHGRPDFVVVDHLHELSSTKDFRSFRSQELGYIAKLLKKTAKRLDIPFFVPMQFNRGPGSESRRPTKHDLRDSGEVENACDRLVLIHTPKVDMRGTEQTDNQLRVMVELIQAKSRNGPIGHREFWFDRHLTLYSDIGDGEMGGRSAWLAPESEKRGTPEGGRPRGGRRRDGV